MNFIIYHEKAVILVGCASRKIKLVDFYSNELIYEVNMINGWIREIKFIPNKSLIIANCWNKDISCWRINKTKINRNYDWVVNKIEIIKLGDLKYIFVIYDGELYYKLIN